MDQHGYIMKGKHHNLWHVWEVGKIKTQTLWILHSSRALGIAIILADKSYTNRVCLCQITEWADEVGNYRRVGKMQKLQQGQKQEVYDA